MLYDTTVTDMLELNSSALTAEELARLKAEFDYVNPDRAKKERLGFYVGHVPRRIETWEERDGRLRLPRGGTDKLRAVLGADNIRWLDRRLHFPEVEFGLGAKAQRPDPRPYQERIIDAALARENCLIRAATGSGKTEAALEIIRRARQPALVIVWTSGLLRQWVERIRLRWGWSESAIGVWGGGKKRLGNGITIAMQQALVGHVDELRDRFGLVICDEVQRFAAKTFREVVGRFPARYRIGISADERRKDRLDFLIRDLFGDVVAEVRREELEATGQLCEVEVVLVPTGFSIAEVEAAAREDRRDVVAGMYGEILSRMAADEDRNALARKIAAECVRSGQSTLLFCNRVAQARELARGLAVYEQIPCGLMLGGAPNRPAFEDAKERLKSGELRAAVGSSATYQGEDVPRLSAGVVVTPAGNNRQLFEQMVGRLRRKFPGKVKGRVYVLWDERLFPGHRDNLERWYGKQLVRVEER